MSIHKSKGLEREIVIIPYCEFTFNPNGNQDTLWATHSTEGIKLDVLMKATQGLSDSLFSEVYLKESDKIRLDNLNKLYVALTRAKEKLFIFSKLPTKSEKASSASTLLYNVVSADAFSLAQNWDKENKKFELGENNTNLNINTDASNSLIITDYKKTDWRKEIIIKNSIDADKLLNEDIQAGLLEGNIIHKIFSNMFFIEDLDAAINKIYFEGLISSDQIAKIKNDITELLNISEVNSWFSEKDALIYNEKEIILSNGEIIRFQINYYYVS
jgi:ATP-dependent helicase/nuclease subunit A